MKTSVRLKIQGILTLTRGLVYLFVIAYHKHSFLCFTLTDANKNDFFMFFVNS